MKRFVVAVLVAAATTVPGIARGDAGAFGAEPAAGCASVYDVAHDATGGDPALDIVGLTVGVTATEVRAVIETAAPLATAQAPFFRIEVTIAAPAVGTNAPQFVTPFATDYTDPTSPLSTKDGGDRTGGVRNAHREDVRLLRHPTRPLVALVADRAAVESVLKTAVDTVVLHVSARTYALPPMVPPSTGPGVVEKMVDQTPTARVDPAMPGCLSPGWVAPRPMPNAGCVLAADSATDGPGDPAAEIAWVAATTDPDRIRFVVKVGGVGDPTSGQELTYEVGFTLGTGEQARAMALKVVRTSSTARLVRGAVKDSVQLYDGTKSGVAPARVAYAPATGTVTLDFAVGDANEYLVANHLPPIGAGTELRDVTVQAADVGGPPSAADTVGGTGTSYRYGDRHCFTRPTVLTAVAPAVVRYGDAVAVGAALRTDTGEPVAAAPVAVTYGGRTTSVVTGPDGVATLRVVAGVAGGYPVSVAFAGTDELAESALRFTVRVGVRPTALVLSARRTGSTVTVRATLRDDRLRAVPGARLTWSVDGHQVRAATTDAAGNAVLGGVRPGATVVVSAAAVPGRYAATKATVHVA